MRPTLAGFLAGSFIPFAYGVQWMANDISYRAAMPKLPNQAFCGMGTLGAIALLFVIGPACGAVGAVVGWAITRKFRRK